MTPAPGPDASQSYSRGTLQTPPSESPGTKLKEGNVTGSRARGLAKPLPSDPAGRTCSDEGVTLRKLEDHSLGC